MDTVERAALRHLSEMRILHFAIVYFFSSNKVHIYHLGIKNA